MADITEGAAREHELARQAYGTPEQREQRSVDARDQLAGAQSHGNEAAGSVGL
ncbi:hypothetical protein [Streptomyces sp. NRRL S-350]|uniref:hypothetical protein n=1 Tax=Streptomyces sp. NRRL S-350 TaxID=1463902 RepID=UPI000A53F01A|nr:hypothetical protein [Streptomyces sp. NRRL S-350]